jgi:hypothetical protein
MTASMSGSASWARVRSWRGEKQTTRQVPRTGSTRNRGSTSATSACASGASAAKSLSKVNVCW